MKVIQLASADKLADVMTDDLASFLRQLLQEANIVQESIALGPILQQIGAIEEDRVDEAISRFTSSDQKRHQGRQSQARDWEAGSDFLTNG